MSYVSLPIGGAASPGMGRDVHQDVGRGQIFDSSAFTSSSSSSPSTLPTWSTPRSSQYHLAQSEVLKGLANRFVHSTSYLYLYGSMAFASLLTVIMSLMTDCPGTIFYVVEMIVNAVLVVEVGVRFIAFGRQFWHSTFNILDLFLVFLCTLTLLIIFFSHDCSPYNRGSSSPSKDGRGGGGGRQGKGEELLDSFLLIFRNGMQLIRLLAVVRRSGKNALSRPSRIDLDPASVARRGGGVGGGGGGGGGAAGGIRPGNDFSLDIDLEDDAEATRSRMRDGGDWNAGRGAKRRGPEQQSLMQQDDEEEEEL